MNNQGGLTGINEISGNAAMNLSEMQGTMPNYHFGDITRANFGKGSEVAANRAFNAAEVIKNFSDSGAVGINPFAARLPEGAGEKMHVIG